jgi:hypothetical protein
MIIMLIVFQLVPSVRGPVRSLDHFLELNYNLTYLAPNTALIAHTSSVTPVWLQSSSMPLYSSPTFSQ